MAEQNPFVCYRLHQVSSCSQPALVRYCNVWDGLEEIAYTMIAFSSAVPLVAGTRSLPSVSSSRAKVTMIASGKMRTLVTGAAGRTGRLALERLCERDEFDARGMVRSKAGVEGRVKDELHEFLVEGDVTDIESLKAAMDGMDAVIILTSAVPVPLPTEEGAPPSFTYAEGAFPQVIDYDGGVNQIEAAKSAGVKHVVFVGSMGSTDDSNMLNRIGPNGNILRFKRKAEEYLMKSGLPFTVINPGGLLNDPAGERQLQVGKNDEMYTLYGRPSIPRGDVAELAVQAVLCENAKNKALDVLAKPPGDGSQTTDFEALFAQAGGEL